MDSSVFAKFAEHLKSSVFRLGDMRAATRGARRLLLSSDELANASANASPQVKQLLSGPGGIPNLSNLRDSSASFARLLRRVQPGAAGSAAARANIGAGKELQGLVQGRSKGVIVMPTSVSQAFDQNTRQRAQAVLDASRLRHQQPNVGGLREAVGGSIGPVRGLRKDMRAVLRSPKNVEATDNIGLLHELAETQARPGGTVMAPAGHRGLGVIFRESNQVRGLEPGLEPTRRLYQGMRGSNEGRFLADFGGYGNPNASRPTRHHIKKLEDWYERTNRRILTGQASKAENLKYDTEGLHAMGRAKPDEARRRVALGMRPL